MPEFGQSFTFLLSAKVPKHWDADTEVCSHFNLSFIVHWKVYWKCTFEKEISSFWFWWGNLLHAWGVCLWWFLYLKKCSSAIWTSKMLNTHSSLMYTVIFFFLSWFFKAGMTKGLTAKIQNENWEFLPRIRDCACLGEKIFWFQHDTRAQANWALTTCSRFFCLCFCWTKKGCTQGRD